MLGLSLFPIETYANIWQNGGRLLLITITGNLITLGIESIGVKLNDDKRRAEGLLEID